MNALVVVCCGMVGNSRKDAPPSPHENGWGDGTHIRVCRLLSTCIAALSPVSQTAQGALRKYAHLMRLFARSARKYAATIDLFLMHRVLNGCP